jgi:Flp pilus assembly protein TadG
MKNGGCNLLHLFQNFLRQERGAVLIIFGLALIPMMAGVGIAIDSSMVYRKRASLQNAVDIAALSAAKGNPVDDTTLAANLRTTMNPLLVTAGITNTDWEIISAHDGDGKVTAVARATIKTQLLALLQKETVVVDVSTEISRAQKKLEVVLVMDNTGSMTTNNRIGALRDAAKTLVDTLYAGPNASTMIKVALVPFVTSVNIKATGSFDMTWMDTGAAAKHHGENFELTSSARTSHFKLFNDLGVTWRGCVEARAEPYDVLDAAPDPLVPDTLFVPWFWPDEPDSGTSYVDGTDYNNNYMPDDYTKPTGVNSNATAPARQKNITKYLTKKSQASIDEVPSATSGPNKSCADPLTPLTTDANLMRTRLAAMMPWNNSGTNIAQGMMWGWSVLSPTPPFTEGAAYNDPETEKIMIVLTDGENEVYGGWSNHNKSDYSSYNYLGMNRLGATSKTTGVQKVNNKVTTLCQNIKAKNIRIYTITFELGSSTAQNLFSTCATSASMYFNSPSTTELNSIFKTIAGQIGSLRYTR